MLGRIRQKSRNSKSNVYTGGVIQLSTLERSHRRQPVYRYVTHSASIASAVSGLQVAAVRSLAAFMIVILTLFYPAGVYAGETAAPEAQPAETSSEVEKPEAPAKPAPPPKPAKPKKPTKPAKPQVKKVQPKKPAPKTGPKKQPGPKSPTGPKKPNGANAKDYKYNEATGMWENGVYAWDPSTGQTKPLKDPKHAYNPETGMWDTEKWRYDESQGKYVPNTNATWQADGSEVKLNSDSSHFFGLYQNVGISNNIDSQANSGNAGVIGNTLGGNALTGDALAIANIINMLNSSTGFSGEIATFSSDIYGDVFGDLYIDPSALAATQPASGIGASNVDVNVNAELDHKIVNNISLDAQSGDAAVQNNTTAGDATSGSAHAVANIVNMLNSAISTGSSFMGVLNIYGSLNGDILLPMDLLRTLLASGGSAPGGSHTVGGSASTTIDADLSDSQSIANNVLAHAQSGDAAVQNNTTAGSAQTGTAQTNVTILNLTGRQVVAANSMLVFVNVLGEWVGVIMDAPAGSTSAALGTKVTQNSTSLDADYDVDSNAEIVNNVEVNAQSGDAKVASNTTAGDASSGDATASANIANFINSSFSLSDWFGVLFINVFGSWNGSFGVDTAAGNSPSPSSGSGGSTGSNTPKPKVFRFVSNGHGGTTMASVDINNEVSAEAVRQAEKAATQKVKADSNTNPRPADDAGNAAAGGQDQSSPAMHEADYFLPVLGFAIGGTMLGGERFVSRRQRRKTQL